MAKSNSPYQRYMRSAAWRAKRIAAIERARFRCELCGGQDGPFAVHHKHYDTVFNERPDDLMCLCDRCHRDEDRRRRERDKDRSRMDAEFSEIARNA